MIILEIIIQNLKKKYSYFLFCRLKNSDFTYSFIINFMEFRVELNKMEN